MPKLYTIEGNPVPLARPRFNRSTNHIYDSQKLQKIHAGLELEQQHGDDELLKGPLAFYVTFFMPVPKKYSSRKRNEMNGTLQRSRPDLDNLVKMVLDIANNRLFSDDAQIAVISARKIYSFLPQTVFSLVELHENK